MGHLYTGNVRIKYPKNSYEFPKKERASILACAATQGHQRHIASAHSKKDVVITPLLQPRSSSASSSLRGFRGSKASGGGGLGDEGEKAAKLATELATFSHYGFLSLSKRSGRRGNAHIAGDVRSLILDWTY